MNRTHTLIYSPNKNLSTFNILESLSVDVHVKENAYNLPLDFLFGMAARKNKKRGFLFVSKILGKHIPVAPVTSLLSGALLAIRLIEDLYKQQVPKRDEIIEALLTGKGEQELYQELMRRPFKLPEETLFIGFAETATSLGQSVFDLFDNAAYIHTTREQVQGLESVIKFEEEHSHATAQSCFGKEELFKKDGPIVLVDDEITTGKTAINIIEAIHQEYPRDEYMVVSLLDWRSEEDKKRYHELEQRLGITVKTVTLLAGEITVEGTPVEEEGIYEYSRPSEPIPAIVEKIHLNQFNQFKRMKDLDLSSVTSNGHVNRVPYSAMTGRFNGVSSNDRTDINYYARNVGEALGKTRSGGRALCLGTGEFMYLPMKIAAFMGENIYFQSTTRSPIHRVDQEGYAVRSGFSFSCPDDDRITNYFYNIEYGSYEDIYLCLERNVPDEQLSSLLEALQDVGAKRIFVVIMNEGDMFNDGQKQLSANAYGKLPG